MHLHWWFQHLCEPDGFADVLHSLTLEMLELKFDNSHDQPLIMILQFVVCFQVVEQVNCLPLRCKQNSRALSAYEVFSVNITLPSAVCVCVCDRLLSVVYNCTLSCSQLFAVQGTSVIDTCRYIVRQRFILSVIFNIGRWQTAQMVQRTNQQAVQVRVCEIFFWKYKPGTTAWSLLPKIYTHRQTSINLYSWLSDWHVSFLYVISALTLIILTFANK